LQTELNNFDPQRQEGTGKAGWPDPDALKPIALHSHRFPSRDGKPGHTSKAIRWILDGAKLRAGGRLRLQAVRGPGGWLCRDSWITEFLEELTADRMAVVHAKDPGKAPAAPGTRSDAARRMAADQAMRELAELGV
jgi:hypothetical protein